MKMSLDVALEVADDVRVPRLEGSWAIPSNLSYAEVAEALVVLRAWHCRIRDLLQEFNADVKRVS